MKTIEELLNKVDGMDPGDDAVYELFVSVKDYSYNEEDIWLLMNKAAALYIHCSKNYREVIKENFRIYIDSAGVGRKYKFSGSLALSYLHIIDGEYDKAKEWEHVARQLTDATDPNFIRQLTELGILSKTLVWNNEEDIRKRVLLYLVHHLSAELISRVAGHLLADGDDSETAMVKLREHIDSLETLYPFNDENALAAIQIITERDIPALAENFRNLMIDDYGKSLIEKMKSSDYLSGELALNAYSAVSKFIDSLLTSEET